MKEAVAELSPMDMLAKARTDMNLFNEILSTLDATERNHYHQWWMLHQEVMTWEQYKENGFAAFIFPTEKLSLAQLNDERAKIKKLGYLPTGLARTSPFFPMKKGDPRVVYDNMVVENKWGKININGPKLSILDETVLLVSVQLATQRGNEFVSSLAELCGLCGVSRGANTYNAIRDSLERMTKVVVSVNLYNTEDAVKKVVDISSGAILSNVRIAPDTGKIIIFINPYFVFMYGQNLTTSIDLDERARLKGDIAKALHRFLETHNSNKYPYSLLTLSQAINLDLTQPSKQIKRLINAALSELKRHGFIKKGSKVDGNNMVYILR